MENQKLLDLDTDLPEHVSKTNFSVPDDDVLSEEVKNNFENDIDDLILMPEKVINTEKQPSLENTFEVIEQETKLILDDESTDISNISKDEIKENILENDIVNTETEDHETLPKAESPIKEPVISEKLETKVTDTTKTVLSEESEPSNVVQPEVKIANPPAFVPNVSTSSKKDSDEGDVCDIKIGPEELFCRIGLGKIIQLFIYFLYCKNIPFKLNLINLKWIY